MARLRRMYALLLFVVVGIFGVLLTGFLPQRRFCPPCCGTAPWHGLALRIYAGGMNEAIQPGLASLPPAAVTPQLSVIIPTFNERDNVTRLFRRLETALAGVAWEAVFVDDNSPDGTWDVVRGLAAQDNRVRCIRRIGRRGLSGACIEA